MTDKGQIGNSLYPKSFLCLILMNVPIHDDKIYYRELRLTVLDCVDIFYLSISFGFFFLNILKGDRREVKSRDVGSIKLIGRGTIFAKEKSSINVEGGSSVASGPFKDC